MVFPCMDVRVGPLRRLSTEELMLSTCGVGEDSWESLAARRSNQTILKEINSDYSLEGLMLKLLYFDHLMQKVNSIEKTLMLGKTEGRREGTTEDETVGWHHRLNGHQFKQALGVGDGQGSLACCSPWVTKSWT